MKAYFLKTNANNLVVVTDGKTAKVYDAAPKGIYQGMDLYSQDAAERLKKLFLDLDQENDLDFYNDFFSPDEIPEKDIADELENAVLVFEK